jgi:sugar phosphate isomerase/epimerase
MERRTFIKKSSMTALWALAWSQYACSNPNRISGEEMGLQLYTVRDDMDADPIGTLKKLSEMGYRHIESAGYHAGMFYDMSPKAFRKVLDDNGLNIFSGHNATGTDKPGVPGTLYNEWEKAVADAAETGQKYMVIAYLVESERQTLDDYKRLINALNKAGETCNQYGLQLAYHNHDFEFETLEGKIPYDLMLEQIDPKLMKFELDLYWITKAGYDPITYFKKHPGRFPLWHVKDMDDTAEQYFTEVGNGVIDWVPIFEAAAVSGMEHFYVEQDQCRNHKPMESVAISLNYLQQLRYG